MKKLITFPLFFSLGLLIGCSNSPYRGCDVYGADEFVIDSYKISEGKLSILELEGRSLEPLHPSLLEEYEDRIQNGDVLTIALYHPTRGDIVAAVQSIGASIGYIVENNKIILPDLSPILIGGLTLTEAREKIQNAYDNEIKEMQVFLSYKSRNRGKISLVGLVNTDFIPVDGKLRLYDVIATAQIPPSANLFKSYLVRDAELVPVDMYKLVKEGDMSQNIVMKGEDKLYIADSSASRLMVMGEVRREVIINLPSGFISLREALAEAGGIPYTGDKAFIQVIRGNILRPKIYTLHWKHVMRLPTNSILLMPGDIVYVAATPLTEWNHFVTQIFPTLTAIELFRKGVSGVVAIQ